MADQLTIQKPPKLGQKYAHHWFTTTPHGVWELAALIDQAIAEAFSLREKTSE